MKKGQRPARHIRRIKTRRGVRTKLINRDINKSARNYSNWTMVGGDPSPTKTRLLQQKRFEEEMRLRRLRTRRSDPQQSVLEEYRYNDEIDKPLRSYGSLASKQNLHFDYDFDELARLRREYGSDLSREDVYKFAVKDRNQATPFEELPQIAKIELNLIRSSPGEFLDPIQGYKTGSGKLALGILKTKSKKQVLSEQADELTDSIDIFRLGKERGEELPYLKRYLESRGINPDEV